MTTSFEGLDRSNLHGHVVEVLARGRGGKADLLVIEWRSQRAVLKDFVARALPFRLTGWLQINRELRAYRRLQGIPGVPRIYRRLDRYGFLMEEIHGRHLPRFRLRAIEQRRELLGQLGRILDAAHAAGVIHNDARGRDNTLVSEEGRVYLVDFAGAVCLAPGSLLHALLFKRLASVDAAAFLKWKAIMLPEELSEQERRRLRRYGLLRRLWFFNPKGWGRFDAVTRAGRGTSEEETRDR